MEKKDWTIMVYMSGDNNLSREMALALQEIRDSARITQGNINLLAFFDTSIKEVPTSYYDFTNYLENYEPIQIVKTPRRYANRSTNVRDSQTNSNAATISSVLDFIDWSVNDVEYEEIGEKYQGRKATNYALIFSGHSFGFLNFGLFADEGSNYHMTLAKLRWGLEEEIKKITGQSLGVLGFDSCVMSMLEVGYTFRNAAEVMIASEGTIPNTGWTYRKLIEKIAESPKASPKEISSALVNTFVKTNRNFMNGGISIDMAAWDLVKVNDVETNFTDFANNLLKCFEDKESTIYKQMQRIILQVRWKCQPYMYDQNIDLIDFGKSNTRNVPW